MGVLKGLVIKKLASDGCKIVSFYFSLKISGTSYVNMNNNHIDVYNS
jgi:hypothetical protein